MSRPQQWLRTVPSLYTHDSGYVETPHSAQVHVAGDLDLRWFGALPEKTFDSQRTPTITKGEFVTVDNRAYQFGVQPNPANREIYFSTQTASGFTFSTSTVQLPPSLFGSGQFFWMRVTRRQSDGRLQFFYSEDHDNPSWTKLGADVTGSTEAIPNRGNILIGRDEYSAYSSLLGHTGKVEIRDGIDGTVVASPDFTETGPWQLGDDDVTNPSKNDPQGNTWTIKTINLAIAAITNYDWEQFVYLPGGSGDYVESPDHNDFDLTDSLRLDLLLKPGSWADEPLAEQTLISKSASGNQSFYLDLWGFGSGQLQLGISNSGSGFSVATSSVAVPFSDGEWGWIRAEWRASDGRVQFFTQEFDPYNPWNSGNSWVQLGTDQVASSGSNMFVGTAPVRIGNRPGKTFNGAIKYAAIGEAAFMGRVANPRFAKADVWEVGDDSTTPARNDGDGKPWSLEGNAVIKETKRLFFPGEVGGLKIGSTTAWEKDLESEAAGGLVLGSNITLDTRIVGQAEGKLVFGSNTPVAVAVVGRGSLILNDDMEVIPPELVAGVGSVWSVGLAGKGFVLSSLDQESPFEFRSYEIQAIPQQRPQIDDRDEPGEQTLFPWWSRAQHSWHEGAGQHIFDSPFSSRFRYCESRGFDPWDTTGLRLLKDTSALRTDTVDDHHLWGGQDALFYTRNGNLHRDPDPDATGEANEATESTHDGTPINSITSDGESIYAAFSGGSLGIKKCPVSGALSWTDVNAQTAVELIAFVKGRLIGAKGASVYEYDLASTTEPNPFYTDEASSWTWTGITESGPAIYFSGFAGDRSEIFAARLTAQDIQFASIATLGAMVSVWQAPEGETIHTIKGYLGKQVLIGTSEGIRVGTIASGEGDLEVSPLITNQVEGHPIATDVKTIEPQGNYAWFGWTNYDGNHSGLGRLHLGELFWSSDLMYAGQGEVKSAISYKDQRYFVVDEGAGSDSHIVKEHATDLVATANMKLCTIRFGTTESKILRYLDIRGDGAGDWSFDIKPDDDPTKAVTVAGALSPLDEVVVNIEAGRFGLDLTATRDELDATQQFILKEWRLRAEPRSKGRFRYYMPLMVYDYVSTLAGNEVGHTGYAMENLETLMDLYRTGRDTLLHRLGTGVPGGPGPVLVTMEDLRFKTYTPPEGARGFGGIALAIVREVR